MEYFEVERFISPNRCLIEGSFADTQIGKRVSVGWMGTSFEGEIVTRFRGGAVVVIYSHKEPVWN